MAGKVGLGLFLGGEAIDLAGQPGNHSGSLVLVDDAAGSRSIDGANGLFQPCCNLFLGLFGNGFLQRSDAGLHLGFARTIAHPPLFTLFRPFQG